MMPMEITQVLSGAGPQFVNVHDIQAASDYAQAHEIFQKVTRLGGLGDVGATDREADPFEPELVDLVRLHSLIISRRVTNVLEFGVGWSSLIMADALRLNESKHAATVSSRLRRTEPFRLYSVDDSASWIKTAASRLESRLRSRVHFIHSSVQMATFNDRICTRYNHLPDTCPDLIYLDGPSQSSAQGEVNGISTRHADRLPMSCDIAMMEHFLLPGTLIVVDGRTANVRFLLANLQRRWWHYHDRETDAHYLELREDPLGHYNDAQIRYCLGEAWLDRLAD